MKLSEIIKDVSTLRSSIIDDPDIQGITVDSRQVKHGYAFIAVQGAAENGEAYIPQAVSNGASCIFTTNTVANHGVPTILVPDSRKAVHEIAASFYGHPQKKLKIIGITGTNGKTTSSYIIAQILRASGFNTGVIGTISWQTGGVEHKSSLTTPGPIQLYSMLAEMVSNGDKYVVMEVSSHALDQDRIGGLEFDGAIFTNLTRDHLDYHKTFEQYATAKAKLLEKLKPEGIAAVNFADEWGEYVSRKAAGKVVPFGFKGPVQVESLSLGFDGSEMTLRYGERKVELRTHLVGRFNAKNILGAATLAYGLGIEVSKLKEAIESMPCVPGRLERITNALPRVYVDYAHTDDALENALNALKELPHSRLITVFGCGGDRDTGKRPLMGEVAQRVSDIIFVTSDNPRTEDPASIIEDILRGIKNPEAVTVVPDRRQAIFDAVVAAHENDIVLVAGKGHEDYQIIGNLVVGFDDRLVVKEALKWKE